MPTVRALPAGVQELLEQRKLVARDFISFRVRNRETQVWTDEHIWSDIHTVDATVIDPNTGLEDVRTFTAAGSLVSISPIVHVSNLQVQTVTIRLNKNSDKVNDIVRYYDCKQGNVEIFRGLFNPDTKLLEVPAFARFAGFIDELTIHRPAGKGEAYSEMKCVSHTQEMTRSNPDTRSQASQVLRRAGDTFFDDSSASPEWEIFWGTEKGKIPGAKKKKFLGLF